MDNTSLRRVRLADVAKAAGVSSSIASRVLNDYEGLNVRPETRQRVRDTAERLQYRPHLGAVGLRMSHVGVVGLLVPDLTNAVTARVVRGAVARAEEHDVTIFVSEDTDPAETTKRAVDLIRAGRIDGFIVASARPRHPLVRQLRDARIPHVFVNRGVRGSRRNVTLNDALASELATVHLVELGHRHLLHVAGPQHINPANRRAKAFVAACAARGVEHSVVSTEFTEEGGYRAVSLLMEGSQTPTDFGPTGIYTSSLRQGVGVLSALDAAGRPVPQDISVVTYDDVPLAEFTVPSLTAIRMPLAELGAAAVDLLLSQLGGAESGDVTVDTAPELVIRGSTGPRRG